MFNYVQVSVSGRNYAITREEPVGSIELGMELAREGAKSPGSAGFVIRDFYAEPIDPVAFAAIAPGIGTRRYAKMKACALDAI